MNEDTYSLTESKLNDKDLNQKPPEIWNPNACLLWSLLFTPIFGSILVKKNWEALGEKEMAEKSGLWIIVSFIVFIPSMFVFGTFYLYVAVWYFLSQKQQAAYVKEKWGENYYRKHWRKPLAIGFLVMACILGFVAGPIIFYVLIIMMA